MWVFRGLYECFRCKTWHTLFIRESHYHWGGIFGSISGFWKRLPQCKRGLPQYNPINFHSTVLQLSIWVLTLPSVVKSLSKSRMTEPATFLVWKHSLTTLLKKASVHFDIKLCKENPVQKDLLRDLMLFFPKSTNLSFRAVPKSDKRQFRIT